MTSESDPPTVNTDQLADAAMREDWDFVDSVIGGVANNEVFLGWAAQNLDADDPNIRDLAASLYEKSSIIPEPGILAALRQHMVSDENPYARFRSAFALFRHGDRTNDVVSTVHSALNDEDVADIARGYLNQPK